PIYADNENYVLSVNGEIYNHEQIKLDKLNKKFDFNTDSDCEIILLLFKKFGIDLCTEETCESCGRTQKVKDRSAFPPKLLSDVADDNAYDFCRLYSAWFMAKKGVLLGRIIGDTLTADLIPSCYADAIRKAKEVSTRA
ncbi:MAG: hypothetical protein QMB62_06210, partial [Oscillospiraceae bacterium]